MTKMIKNNRNSWETINDFSDAHLLIKSTKMSLKTLQNRNSLKKLLYMQFHGSFFYQIPC